MSMKVHAKPEKITQTSWRSYTMRFVLGGLVTAAAGILGKTFGSAVGGLFLAFPTIATASLTLVEQHEGKGPAGVDAMGDIFGCVGMLAFALVVWGLATRMAAWLVLLVACCVWLAVSILVWFAVQQARRHRPR